MRARHRTILLIISLMLFVAICSAGGLLIYKKSHVEADVTQAAQSEQVEVADEAITKQAAADALAKSNAELATIVNSVAQPYGTKVGAVILDLSNGASASVNADQPYVSASIFKLFVAYGIYQKIDDGSLLLSDVINSYGTNRTIDECLDLMLTVSDNDCGYVLGWLYGPTALDAKLLAEGYLGTRLDNVRNDGSLTGDKYTTARDVALLLQRLYEGKLLSVDSASRFIAYLKESEQNNRLSTGLPAGAVIAHKTGNLYGYAHDVGIMYGAKKDVIVVLLTGEWDYPATDSAPVFTGLSSAVWAYMNE